MEEELVLFEVDRDERRDLEYLESARSSPCPLEIELALREIAAFSTPASRDWFERLGAPANSGEC